MKKQGEFLLQNFLEILLFVIGTGMLVLLVWYLLQATIFQEKHNAQQALATIDEHAKKLTAGQEAKVTIKGPCKGATCNWYLDVYSKADVQKPDRCFLDSCICVCQGDPNAAGNTCQTNGYCKRYPVSSISLDPKLQIVLVAPSEGYGGETTYYSRLPLRSNLHSLIIRRESDALIVHAST